jgi:hypothetical protein
MSPPIWSSWFQEVVPAVLRGMRDHNKAAGKTDIRGRAVFLITQAYGEQSPGVTGAPSRNQNRLFNLQAKPKGFNGGQPFGVADGQTEGGVSIGGLSQGEGATVAERVALTSPTFFYDSPYRAVLHFLKMMPKSDRYPKAYEALVSPSGTLDSYFKNLQDAGFATHKNYAEDMKATYRQVLPQLKAWLKYRIADLNAKIAALEPGVDRLTETQGIDLTGIGDFDETKRQAGIQLAQLKPKLNVLKDESTLLGDFLGEFA